MASYLFCERYVRLKNMKTRPRRILFAKEHMYTPGAKMAELPVTLGTRKPVSRLGTVGFRVSSRTTRRPKLLIENYVKSVKRDGRLCMIDRTRSPDCQRNANSHENTLPHFHQEESRTEGLYARRRTAASPNVIEESIDS